ncbi:50S ribosomal protein L24 [Posidoniimonas corsicana]|uniref:Large ribosomal subunit protein uL24 n=1 Tax=Posidoniimonas corsicana TaxID=1938618 RepID=A0A5C5VGL0_9BACT|nr:50S ribosomal protein L24 [Posidoniimonas corsicana]TWT36772.1 50S ribosomal protein L24 [Posidoniimonas corsicana]
MLIKTGDTVQIITGADKGVRSRVTSIDRAKGKALVEGANMVLKHVRRSQKYPQGGRLHKEMPIQLSNLAYFCESCSKPTRLGARYLDDGAKERFCKKCGAGHGEIAPAKASHAKK